ncbi:hypothetical protein HRbin40_01439 [bacterium HR40]|nr:hypothetical protein HRbin40_01439 [bacterium HR40]
MAERCEDADRATTGQGGDRRLFRRYAVGVTGRVLAATGTMACTVHDLSLAGAGISPAFPELVGQRVHLLFDGLDLATGIPARVLRAAADRSHLQFEPDEQAEEALTFFLLMSGAIDGVSRGS